MTHKLRIQRVVDSNTLLAIPRALLAIPNALLDIPNALLVIPNECEESKGVVRASGPLDSSLRSE